MGIILTMEKVLSLRRKRCVWSVSGGERIEEGEAGGSLPLPHQAESHRERSEALGEDLGDEGQGDTA